MIAGANETSACVTECERMKEKGYDFKFDSNPSMGT